VDQHPVVEQLDGHGSVGAGREVWGRRGLLVVPSHGLIREADPPVALPDGESLRPGARRIELEVVGRQSGFEFRGDEGLARRVAHVSRHGLGQQGGGLVPGKRWEDRIPRDNK